MIQYPGDSARTNITKFSFHIFLKRKFKFYNTDFETDYSKLKMSVKFKTISPSL